MIGIKWWGGGCVGTFVKSVRNLGARLKRAFLSEKVFLVLIVLVVILIAAGTGFYIVVEKFKWVDSFLYSVMMVTSVGAAEVKPHTTSGKLFTAIYTFFGTAVYLGFVTGLAQAVIIREHKKEKGN